MLEMLILLIKYEKLYLVLKFWATFKKKKGDGVQNMILHLEIFKWFGEIQKMGPGSVECYLTNDFILDMLFLETRDKC